jgi:hypothetical protein
MNRLKHQYNIGEIKNCQICGKKNLVEVLDLGYQPLADDLVPLKSKKKEVLFYPLKVSFCSKCILLQNNYIVGDKRLYPKNYHYIPGITKAVVKNFSEMSNFLLKKYNVDNSQLIVDVGCNDGSLLYEFKKLGHKNLLGIEPTDTVNFAKDKKISVMQDFFNISSATKAKKKYGKAKLITTTNVFAHTNNLAQFILGVKSLIHKDGVFVLENHYLLDVVKKCQFDTFYHEHLRTYSLNSLLKLMKFYDFNLIDAYQSERYGGNIQAHFSLKKTDMSFNAIKILKTEKVKKLDKVKTYYQFRKKIEKCKNDLENYLIKNKKKLIVGKAFPARASILIHYFSFLKNHIKYIAEQPKSKKLNYFAPGTELKILSSNNMRKKKPDIIIVLAWHLYDSILKKWKKILGKKVKIIRPLPSLLVK